MADVIIIGGGPAGYPAAFRLAGNGLSVTVIEERQLGGECTNYGCVPTKALLSAARKIHESRIYDWLSTNIDSGRVLEWTREVVEGVRSGLERLFDSYGITVVRERAVEIRGRCVRVESGNVLCAEKAILIATGSRPRMLPDITPDGKKIHNNRSIMSISRIPDSIAIVGAGFVGVEFSWALANLGSRVTLIEIMDRVLPQMEPEASRVAARSLARAGVRFMTKARVEKIGIDEAGVRIAVSGRRSELIRADSVLIAIGRTPNTDIAGLRGSGVSIDGAGFIRVDCGMRAGPGIYAAGDVTGPPLLAHKAIHESLVAAENILGGEACLDRRTPIPEVVYISPEIVRVMPPRIEEGVMFRVRVDALARSRINGEGGFVELFVDSERRVIGAILAFEGASELAGHIYWAIRRRVRLEDLENIVYPHPTMSEALAEAVHYALSRPIHVKSGIRREL